MINRLLVFAVAVVLAAATAYTYAGVTDLGLVYDDHRLVENNPGLDRPIGALFTSDLSGHGGWRLYRPLAALSWKLEDGNVPLHHAMNVVWHVVSAWGVFALALVLGPARRHAVFAGGAAALLFALHPLASEAVCWVSRRPDVMAAAFVLWSVFACAKAVRGPRWWIAVTIFLGIAAVLSKEIGIVAPAVWLWTAYVLRGSLRPWWGIAAAFAVAFAALRLALFGSVAGQPVAFVQNWVFDVPDHVPFVTALGVAARAFWLFFFPRLSADYSWASFFPSIFASIFGLIVLAWWIRSAIKNRRTPAWTIGIALAILAYLPVSNLFVPVGAAFAERFLYLPLAGAALALANHLVQVEHLGNVVRRSSWFELTLAVALAVFLGHRTQARIPDWTNDDTLFASVLERYPTNVVAHTYQGIARRAEGDLDAARAHYDAALEAYPMYHLARVNRAFIMLEQGETEYAIIEAEWIISIEPDPGAPHLVLGMGNLALGNVEEGVESLWTAAADPAIRRDALGRLYEHYQSVGDADGVRRVRRAGAGLSPD